MEKDQYHNNINELINLFEKISYFVPTEVLINNWDNKIRTRIIIKLIKIANNFKDLDNYHCLFAIMAGLNHCSVIRLTNIWQIKKKYIELFNELNELIDAEKKPYLMHMDQ